SARRGGGLRPRPRRVDDHPARRDAAHEAAGGLSAPGSRHLTRHLSVTFARRVGTGEGALRATLGGRSHPSPSESRNPEVDVNATRGDDRTEQSTVPAEPAQGVLFDDVVDTPGELGYRGPAACKAAGITYRQLDYWARTGLVEPGVRAAHGSGSQRLYGFRDILVLKVVKRLLDTGVSLQQIRIAVAALRERGIDDLARSEEHTSELQSRENLVCRLLLEKK